MTHKGDLFLVRDACRARDYDRSDGRDDGSEDALDRLEADYARAMAVVEAAEWVRGEYLRPPARSPETWQHFTNALDAFGKAAGR